MIGDKLENRYLKGLCIASLQLLFPCTCLIQKPDLEMVKMDALQISRLKVEMKDDLRCI